MRNYSFNNTHTRHEYVLWYNNSCVIFMYQRKQEECSTQPSSVEIRSTENWPFDRAFIAYEYEHIVYFFRVICQNWWLIDFFLLPHVVCACALLRHLYPHSLSTRKYSYFARIDGHSTHGHAALHMHFAWIYYVTLYCAQYSTPSGAMIGYRSLSSCIFTQTMQRLMSVALAYINTAKPIFPRSLMGLHWVIPL